jgi:hypothetical protein
LTQFELICHSPKNLTVRLLKQSKQEEEAEKKLAQQAAIGLAPCDVATETSTNIMKNIQKVS